MGETCGYKAILDECDKIDRKYERYLVAQNALLRIRVNELEALVEDLRNPEEVRVDGQTVRKDRWETGFRNIASLLFGHHRPWEIAEVVELVRLRLTEGVKNGNL